MENYKESFKEGVKNVALGAEGILSSENLNQVSHLVGKSLGGFVQDKREKLVNIKDQYEGAIKERPLSSVATAFAVGVIMGLLVRRN